jgi:prefoldin alpha subunit
MSSSNEELLRRLITQFQSLETTYQEIRSRLNLLEAALSELSLASSTLNGIKTLDDESEILIPIGGGSFVKAKLSDSNNVVHSIGSGVSTEKTIELAQADFDNRMSDFQKIRTSLNQQLNQATIAMTNIRNQIQQITQKYEGEAGVRTT